MGPGLGFDPDGRWPIRTIRFCRRPWKSGRWTGLKCSCHAIWKSSTKSIAVFSIRSGSIPRRRFPRQREPDRRRQPRGRSAWPTWPSSARTARTELPRSTPNYCARRPSKTWPSCFPSDFPTRPTASRRGGGCFWPTRACSRAITTQSARTGLRTWHNSPAQAVADDNHFQSEFDRRKREAK